MIRGVHKLRNYTDPYVNQGGLNMNHTPKIALPFLGFYYQSLL